jgi:signal transduction histidine kinase
VVYRILQEALTNIVKHAKATRVDVDLRVAPDAVTLAIRDNGIGISDNAQQNALSHGLEGMRQRARAIHGRLSIARRPEGGTCVEVRRPSLRPSRPGRRLRWYCTPPVPA